MNRFLMSAGVVGVLIGVGGCGSGSSHPAAVRVQKVTQAPVSQDELLLRVWNGKGGPDQLTALHTAFQHVSDVAGEGQLGPDLEAACNNLLAATGIAARNPVAIPRIQTPYQAALDAYTLGATDCVKAVITQDASLIEDAVTQFNQGGVDLNKTTLEVQSTS